MKEKYDVFYGSSVPYSRQSFPTWKEASKFIKSCLDTYKGEIHIHSVSKFIDDGNEGNYRYTIKLDEYAHPTLEYIRQRCRDEGWAGVEGKKEFMKLTYNATLRTNRWQEFTSITFYTDEDAMRFSKDYNTYKTKG